MKSESKYEKQNDLKLIPSEKTVCVNILQLKYIGEAPYTIRTRGAKGYEINKGDVVMLPDGAFGRAYARMRVFEKL